MLETFYNNSLTCCCSVAMPTRFVNFVVFILPETVTMNMSCEKKGGLGSRCAVYAQSGL